MRALLAALLLSFACSLPAQERTAENSKPALEFDAASVQPSLRASNPFTWASGGTLHGERFEFRKVTLLDLMQAAYRFDPDTVFGGSDWLAINRYDIVAKAPAGTPQATLRLMLQSLLSDRFGLALRKDTRPMPALVLANGVEKLNGKRPKMNPALGSGPGSCSWQQQQADSLLAVYFCRNVTMDDFARDLTAMLGDYNNPHVVNSTGLAGAWDFDLEFHQRWRWATAGSSRTTVLDAIRQATGLELMSGSAPMPVVVVERAHLPTPDVPGVTKAIPPRETQFEVASVRLSKLDHQEAFDTTKSGSFQARGADLRGLITHARDIEYSHSDELVFGVPKWNDEPRYDITAKPATLSGLPMTETFRDDQMRLMLWNLLVDRLQIKFHTEQRPGKVYALVATPDALKKLKKADPAQRPRCEFARGMIDNDPRESQPELTRLVVCRNSTMAQFAAQLLGLAPDYFYEEVADETHLAGHYDFTISFSESEHAQLAFAQPEPSSDNQPRPPRAGLSLNDAVRKQLGLRLEPRQRNVQVLVIDHYEKLPKEN